MAVVTYQIVENPLTLPEYLVAFTPYGGGKKLWQCRDSEVMLAGPAETGKTRTALEKLDALMWKYPGAQAAIVRKVRATMRGSVLQTFEKKVLGKNSPVRKYGGKKVESYEYPNGSVIFVGGMDDAGKVLSSERDFIYVNQAEELTLDDWETLLTRTTGRAGNAPYGQLFGDANPDIPKHWIKERAREGKLTFFESRHEDNPTLFDPKTGKLTKQGERTMKVLDNLTGVRKQRLRYGLWVGAEGMVYPEWNREVHLVDSFPIPKDWPRYRVIDFGYTNPFVCLWAAEDEDGRLFVYREMYRTQRLTEDWAREIRRASRGERIEFTLADHDAEDRATLDLHGIPTEPAIKPVSAGIQTVQARLRKAGDGRPRLFFFRDLLVEPDPWLSEHHRPVSVVDEFDGYVWAKVSAKSDRVKEQPVKQDDHGLDALRYLVYYLDGTEEEDSIEDAIAARYRN